MLLLGHLSKLSNTGTRHIGFGYNAKVEQKTFHPQSRARVSHGTGETFLPKREGSSLLQLYSLYGTAFVTGASFVKAVELLSEEGTPFITACKTPDPRPLSPGEQPRPLQLQLHPFPLALLQAQCGGTALLWGEEV